MSSRSKAAPLSLPEVAASLDRLLNPAAVSDHALNGLQVMGSRPIRIVAAAVDASLKTFQLARASEADLLLVHHGLFWGSCEPVTGLLYPRLKLLLESGMGLYASHLPLDLHPVVGNNARLAQGLGLEHLQPFGTYHGHLLGFGGRLKTTLAVGQLGQRLAAVTGAGPKILAFGPKRIRSVAVVSGGAGDLALQAAAQGYDAFVTGEVTHQIYHACREAGIHVIAGGHYATETLGVKALLGFLNKKFKIKTIFIDFPSGL